MVQQLPVFVHNKYMCCEIIDVTVYIANTWSLLEVVMVSCSGLLNLQCQNSLWKWNKFFKKTSKSGGVSAKARDQIQCQSLFSWPPPCESKVMPRPGACWVEYSTGYSVNSRSSRSQRRFLRKTGLFWSKKINSGFLVSKPPKLLCTILSGKISFYFLKMTILSIFLPFHNTLIQIGSVRRNQEHLQEPTHS